MFNAQDEIDRSNIDRILGMFKDPGQIAFTQEGIAKATGMYEIAKRYDPQNPVGWIKDYSGTIPTGVDYRGATDTLSRVAIAIDIFDRQRQAMLKKQENPATRKREF